MQASIEVIIILSRGDRIISNSKIIICVHQGPCIGLWVADRRRRRHKTGLSAIK